MHGGPRPAGPGARTMRAELGQLQAVHCRRPAGHGPQPTERPARPTGRRAGPVRSGTTDHGPRGPVSLTGALGVRSSRRVAFYTCSTMYSAPGPVYAGEKKNRPEGRSTRPSWATLQGRITRRARANRPPAFRIPRGPPSTGSNAHTPSRPLPRPRLSRSGGPRQ